MSGKQYGKGAAFICEGKTEELFYLQLLRYIVKKHNAEPLIRYMSDAGVYYEINHCGAVDIVYFRNVEGIKNIIKQAWWIKQAFKKTPAYAITIFTCYDNDNRKEITPFSGAEWEKFSKDICDYYPKACLANLAASADIEDIFLCDIDSVCGFLNIPSRPVSKLKGNKGAEKIRKLFAEAKHSYGKGDRALDLIEKLNMQNIIDSAPVKLVDVEKFFFE